MHRVSTWALCALLIGTVTLMAQTVAFEAVTVSTTAVGLSSETMNLPGGPATACSFTIETDQVRVRWDGTAPTAGLGQQVAAGQSLRIEGQAAVNNLQFIRSGVADAVASGHCWR